MNLGRLLLGALAIAVIGCGSDSEDPPVAAGGSSPDGGTGGTGGQAGTGGSGGGVAGTGGGGAGTGGAGGVGGNVQPQDYPLFDIANLQYEGAFRLPADTFGESELNFSEGPLEYNSDNNSIYIVGHAHQQAIAEFDVPALVNSTTLTDLKMAGNPRQVFSALLDRVAANPQAIDRVGGMEYVTGPNGPELLVNAYEYYDAPADNTHTTLVVRDATDLSGSVVDGYFELQGRAHTSSWISPIPPAWQPLLGGTHITGSSSGMPIIGRLSVGPSAFVFDPLDIVGNGSVPSPVPTTTLLDFSLDNPLHSDLSNDNGNNDIWTHLSRAVYGFIPPGSRSYVTLGDSGGHATGVCYKCTPTGATQPCGGYCANDMTDNSLYYWLWDVMDLIEVMEGRMDPYAVQPHDYGELTLPFGDNAIGGGTFDPATGLLYLTMQRADDQQGTYANPPVVIVYRF